MLKFNDSRNGDKMNALDKAESRVRTLKIALEKADWAVLDYVMADENDPDVMDRLCSESLRLAEELKAAEETERELWMER